jgi:hypothetical protein
MSLYIEYGWTGGSIQKSKPKKEKKKPVGWTFLNDMAHQGKEKKKQKQKHITEKTTRMAEYI